MWYMLNVHTNVWISTYLYIFCIWSALQICWRLFHRFLVDFLGLPSFPTVDRLHPDLRVSVLVEKSMSVTSQIITLIELDDGKIYRKPLYLMVKTMVSCRFSLKPIHWNPIRNPVLCVDLISKPLGLPDEFPQVQPWRQALKWMRWSCAVGAKRLTTGCPCLNGCRSHTNRSSGEMGMDQYLYIPFLGGWTSINPSYFDVYQGYKVLTHCQVVK